MAKIRLGLLLAAVVSVNALPNPTRAQQVQDRPIRSNPYRDVGGSVVYGRSGELVHEPAGDRCATRQQEAPGSSSAASSERFAGLPPAFRTEAMALVESHAHVADDIAELRRAVVEGDKAAALEIADKVVKELVEHLAREDRFFERMASEHRAH